MTQFNSRSSANAVYGVHACRSVHRTVIMFMATSNERFACEYSAFNVAGPVKMVTEHLICKSTVERGRRCYNAIF